MAKREFGDGLFMVKQQVARIAISTVALLVVLQIDYHLYKKFVYPILIATGALLGMVFVPGIGVEQNGAWRWIGFGGLNFQPAELAKLSAIIFLAYSVGKKGSKMDSFVIGFVPHLLVIGMLVGLLILQPDFGTSVFLVASMGIMLFVSGARLVYLTGFALLGAMAATYAITARAYRMKRILAFLDPWKYRDDIGYQISESLISIGSGGLVGKGLGNSAGKLGYVPELWNDFIATLVAEELGLFGISFLVVLFGLYLWRGFRIAHRAPDAFGTYLAFGLTVIVGLQATANLWVVTGMLPTKGLTLPFVSYGGSSLLVSFIGTGILLNISRQSGRL